MISTISKEGYTLYPIIVPTEHNLRSINFYLLEEAGSLTLIDAGWKTEVCGDYFTKTLSENGFSLQDLSRIIISHNHEDHVGMVNWILEQKDIPIYAHAESIPRLKRDKHFFSMRIDFYKQLYEEMGCGAVGKQQIEELHKASLEHETHKIQGDILTLNDKDTVGGLEAVSTPGHSPDHLVFYDAKRKWLFGGDHLISHISSNAIVEPDQEGKRLLTLNQYMNSLKKCLTLDVDIVFPGHGELINQHKDLINKRLIRIDEKATKILNLIKSEGSTADQVARTCYEHQYQNEFALVMSEIIGHLDYLEMQNRVQKELKGGVWHYYHTSKSV